MFQYVDWDRLLRHMAIAGCLCLAEELADQDYTDDDGEGEVSFDPDFPVDEPD